MWTWFIVIGMDCTCSAGRVLGEPGEGFHGSEAGPHRLHPLLVDGEVDVPRGTCLHRGILHLNKSGFTQCKDILGILYTVQADAHPVLKNVRSSRVEVQSSMYKNTIHVHKEWGLERYKYSTVHWLICQVHMPRGTDLHLEKYSTCTDHVFIGTRTIGHRPCEGINTLYMHRPGLEKYTVRPADG